MPYQLRHVDETIVFKEQSDFVRGSIESLFAAKIREFGRQTRRFEIFAALCIIGVIGAAITGLGALLLSVLILTVTGGALSYLMKQRSNMAGLSDRLDKTRRIKNKTTGCVVKRGSEKELPFVNYA